MSELYCVRPRGRGYCNEPVDPEAKLPGDMPLCNDCIAEITGANRPWLPPLTYEFEAIESWLYDHDEWCPQMTVAGRRRGLGVIALPWENEQAKAAMLAFACLKAASEDPVAVRLSMDVWVTIIDPNGDEHLTESIMVMDATPAGTRLYGREYVRQADGVIRWAEYREISGDTHGPLAALLSGIWTLPKLDPEVVDEMAERMGVGYRSVEGE